MKDQLIKYTTQALARAVGFTNEQTILKDITREYVDARGEGIGEYYSEKKYVKEEVAPTQSLLQQWLWKEHAIWVQSSPIFSANEVLGVSVTISSWKFPVKEVDYNGYDVYVGLECGLRDALQIINKS